MRASAVTPRAVDWLWFPYVPLGKITAVAGQMGQAKSLWTAWLAAAVSQGQGITLGRPGDVVMLNAEDDAEDTIRPRLEAAGADLDRVWIEPNVTLDIDHLGGICDELGDVRLITIDPIQAYLPSNVNSWKGQDVRLALEPLRTFAAERRLAVVLVQHLNRRTDAGDPLARIADSQGIPQLARSVRVWGADPSDPDGDNGTQKVLTRAKGNLAKSKASATYTIVERVIGPALTAPCLQRGDDREVTADDVVDDHETRSQIDEAVEWLRALLADGPVSAKDGQRKAREVGIAEKTLKRAKRRLKVKSEQTRVDGQISQWTWNLEVLPYTYDPLDPLGPLGPLEVESKGAKEAKEANNYKGANGHATDLDEAHVAHIDSAKRAYPEDA
jgi:putative DNA primase/helicase